MNLNLSEKSHEWLVQQLEIDRDRAERLERSEAQANACAVWARECTIIALRMLAREGSLKATTDDERAVIAWVEQQPVFHCPPAERRLADVLVAGERPSREEYEQGVIANGQAALFEDAA